MPGTSGPSGPQHFNQVRKARDVGPPRRAKEGERAPGDDIRVWPWLGAWENRGPGTLGMGKGMCEEGRSPHGLLYLTCGEMWVWAPFPKGPLHPQMLQAPGSSPHSTLALTKALLGFALMKGIGQEGKKWTRIRIPPTLGTLFTLGTCRQGRSMVAERPDTDFCDESPAIFLGLAS